MLEKKEAIALEPLLPKKVKGAGYYAEYRTDDARLTLENIKKSLQYGAEALNYAEVVNFIYEEKRVKGVVVIDHLTGEEFAVNASYVVSAAGPWVDDLRSIDNSKRGKRLHLTKGVHLVFPHHKLPVKQSVYFDVPDGRMIFAIPRGKITYVGTTDTNYNEDKDKVETDMADAIYLIAAVNNMFPSIELEMEDIESSWAGLRPLIHEEGKSPSELSRRDEIFTSETGLISIAGGKLTGYRKMAERIVNRVAKKMEEEQGMEVPDCITETLPLCGSAFKKYKEVKKYIEEIHELIKADGFTAYDAWYLVTTYGVQTETILNYYNKRKEKDKVVRLALSELEFGVAFEMVQSPMDFFIRRTGRLYFDIHSVHNLLGPVSEELKKLFKKEEVKAQEWRETMETELKSHSDFSLERF